MRQGAGTEAANRGASDWQRVFLGDLGEIHNGTTPRRSEPSFWGGSTAWVTPGEITSLRSKWLRTTEDHVSEIGLESTSLTVLPPGTLLVTTRATIGEVAIAGVPVTTNQGFKNLVPHPEYDPVFLSYLLRVISPEMKRLASGSTFDEISKADFASISVAVPGETEQRRIAQILDTVDRAIHHAEAIIDKLEQIKGGLHHDLLTRGLDENGELRDPDRHPDQFQDSVFGRIPQEWQVQRLAQVAEVSTSNVNKKTVQGEAPIYLCNYMDVYNNDVIDGNIDFMAASAAQSEIDRFRLSPGDVMITKDSETPDDIAVPAVVGVEFDAPVLCGYHLALLRPLGVNGAFLANALASTPVNDHFRKCANGTTRYGLRISTIRGAPVPVPSTGEQERICAVLEKHAAVVAKERAAVNQLRAVKDGLMQDLLTGEIRVAPLALITA